MKTAGLIANIVFTFVNLLLGVQNMINNDPSWAIFHYACGAMAWIGVMYFMDGIKKQNK